MTRAYYYTLERLKPSRERKSRRQYNRTEIVCVVSGALGRTLQELQEEFIVITSDVAGEKPYLYR